MRERALLLDAPALDAAGQMALDEALLDAARGGVRALRFFRWLGESPYGATFGYSQPFAEAREAAERRRLPLHRPLIRRLTGGGVVFHDGDITFSCVFPWDRGLTPGRVYEEFHRGVRLALRELGLAAEMNTGRSAGGRPGAECFSKPEPMDLLGARGAKVLGGALRRRRGFGLYQGSLRPEGFPAGREELVRAVEGAFALQWRLPLEREPVSAAVNASAVRLREERYSKESWNQRR